MQAQQDANAQPDTKANDDNLPEKTGLKPIRRALLTVTDKTGLVEFARALASHGVELVSTGGTARALREAGLPVRDISDLTGFPEMLDGRVKTLHPKVHGGILHIRDNAEHVAAVGEHGIEPIDMVVVNLYAFEKTAQRAGRGLRARSSRTSTSAGPSMVRSAAKNFEDVAIVTSVAGLRRACRGDGGERDGSAQPRDALAAGARRRSRSRRRMTRRSRRRWSTMAELQR